MKGYLSQVWSIKRDFQTFQIDHIRRNSNKEADKVANEAIDKHMSRREALQSENPLYKTRLCRYWSGGY
jgi:ribonuclease HI